MGRWLNRDPIGEWGGALQYNICQNNNINIIDFLGLATVIWPLPDKSKPPIGIILPPEVALPPLRPPYDDILIDPPPSPKPPVTDDCVCPKGSPIGKRPKPYPYKPASNGCGPKGIGKVIPDNPMYFTPPLFVSCSFKGSCDYHDECYGTCNSGKERCDADFRMLMRSQCDSCASHLPPVISYFWRTQCYAAAQQYALAVSLPGISSIAYNAGQNKGCEECCCRNE